MQITVLGYYGGYPDKGIGTSGYLLQSGNYNLLLDCGSGVLLELEKVLNPLQLDAVLLSHYHSDHIADVGVLQHYWQLVPGEKKEPVLPIYGHDKDNENFKKLDWFDCTKGYEYDDQGTLNLGPFSITFQLTKHPVVAYAMRIYDENSKETLVYTADTRYFDKLIDFCEDADMLITDTNFYQDREGTKWHMTSEETGYLAKKANVKKVLISHLPQYGDLNDLLKQTKNAAGSSINVMLPKVGEKISLNN